jgi:hypothetical protein
MLIRIVAGLATIAALGSLVLPIAKAEESTVNKVKDTVGDASTQTKKTARTEKRKLRGATGTDNLGKDIKDKANDAGDSLSNSANKAKRDNQ